MNNSKKVLRQQVLLKRKTFSGNDKANEKIAKKLLDVCKKYNKLFIYLSFASETDTLGIIEEFLKEKKEIYVPVCNTADCTMYPVRIFSLDNLAENAYGILEPVQKTIAEVELDAIIIPGAVFDINGNRIGYGKGYYDKFISNLQYSPKKIALCYDFQLKKEIPCESHDVKMDMIITEDRVVTI